MTTWKRGQGSRWHLFRVVTIALLVVLSLSVLVSCGFYLVGTSFILVALCSSSRNLSIE